MGSSDVLPAHGPLHYLRAAARYFFVNAPSREEGRAQVREQANKMHEALGRLDGELARLDHAMRPPGANEVNK